MRRHLMKLDRAIKVNEQDTNVEGKMLGEHPVGVLLKSTGLPPTLFAYRLDEDYAICFQDGSSFIHVWPTVEFGSRYTIAGPATVTFSFE